MLAAKNAAGAAARAAISNALTQGVAVATGLQEHFSWANVASSAVGAGVGWGVNDATGMTVNGEATKQFSGLDKIGRAAFSGFAAGMTTNAMRGGRQTVIQVATDAFGNALGNEWGESLKTSAQEERRAAAQAQVAESSTRTTEDVDPNIRARRETWRRQSVADAGSYVLGNVVSDAGGGVRLMTKEEFRRREIEQMNATDGNESPLPAGWNMRDASAAINAGSQASVGTVQASPSGFDSVTAIGKAYFSRDDVSFSQAISMAWNNGGRDFFSLVGHSIGAEFAADAAVFSSPTVIGSVGLGALAVQQTDAAVADYRRFFGSGDERAAQSLFTQGLTPVVGAETTSYLNAAIDFGSAVGFTASAMRSAWTVSSADQAAGLRWEASQAEGAVTPALRSIADANGGEMLGLHYRLKTTESLARKIDLNPTDTINDALRYTMTFDESSFTRGVQGAMSSMREQGYEQLSLSNTFKPGRPYLGINSTYLTPEGQMFELQFHTPTSFEMKDVVNHPLYEQQRVLPKTDPMWSTLRQQMIQNSSTVPIPPGVSNIKSPR